MSVPSVSWSHLPWLAVRVFLVAVSTRWVDFQVRLAASLELDDSADRLVAFSGATQRLIRVASFLLQFVTSPLLQRFGVGFGIPCLSVAVGVGAERLLPTLVAVEFLTMGAGFDPRGTAAANVAVIGARGYVAVAM